MLIRPTTANIRHIPGLYRSFALQSYNLAAQAFFHSTTRVYSEAAEVNKGSIQEISTNRIGERMAKKYNLPFFRIKSENLQLIEHPENFYENLLQLIRQSKKRIFLASLYIGKTEYGLIDEISNTLTGQKDLKVTILVDGLRSTREGVYDSQRTETESCASLLAALQSRFPDQVEIRAFRAPDLPVWLEKMVGKRFVEGWGLQHMKIYGGDEKVMISGANLSNDYFTNRRDRYVLLEDKMISDYTYELVSTAARYSFSLQSTDRGTKHAPYRLEWDEGRRLDLKINDQERTGPNIWKKHFGNQVEKMTHSWSQNTSHLRTNATTSETVDIVPLLQMGPMQILQETTCVPEILSIANDVEGCQLDFTTGYFSLNPQYAEYILNGRFSSDMITASPKANGFYGSKGVSRHLPAAYTWLTHRFWKKVIKKRRQEKVQINEWDKKSWTYHAKGIWLYPQSGKKPSLTLLGSSNFGIRSAKLDLECTLVVDAWNSPKIQERLIEEISELKRNANDRVGQEMFTRPERKVHWGVKIAAWCIRRML